MKNLKINQKVTDRWYPEAGVGIVKEVLKTRVKIYFERANIEGFRCHLFRYAENGLLTYDSSHLQYLDKFTHFVEKLEETLKFVCNKT